MSENSHRDIIGSFIIGAVVGATLGILFAPAKGKETRAKISDWVEENKELAKEKIEKLEAEIKHRKDQLLKHTN